MPEITVERPQSKTGRVFRACPRCGAMLEGTVVSELGRFCVTYEPCATCFPIDRDREGLEREEC